MIDPVAKPRGLRVQLLSQGGGLQEIKLSKENLLNSYYPKQNLENLVPNESIPAKLFLTQVKLTLTLYITNKNTPSQTK